jgi:hypothetical protein
MGKHVLVYIWKFRSGLKGNFAFGHASLGVQDKNGRNAYISWWPSNPRIYHYPNLTRKLYDASPVRYQTHEDAIQLEEQPPDHTIEITGLDEEKIVDYCNSLGLQVDDQKKEGPLFAWSALNFNCSTVVYEALKAGGATNYAMNYWFTKYWTPNRILEFSQNVKHQISVTKTEEE